MSRAGYSDYFDDNWALIRWRGAVSSAINGSRGQDFLRALLKALDALPNKRLIEGDLVASDGECCAMGALAICKEIPVSGVDPYDRTEVANLFGIAPSLAAEVAFENDDGWYGETPENRWYRMRRWVVSQIKDAARATGDAS